jgi:hypothetical protein
LGRLLRFFFLSFTFSFFSNSRESREGSGGGSESSEEFYSSNTDDEEIENDSSYQEHQFTETYDNMAAERLSNMSKDELKKFN